MISSVIFLGEKYESLPYDTNYIPPNESPFYTLLGEHKIGRPWMSFVGNIA